MSNPRYNRVLAPVEPDIILPEQKIAYFPAAISLGGFLLNTNATGALEAKPVSAPELTPAVSVSQPVSLVSDISGLQVVSTAEFGGRVSLADLLNKLIDIPISVAGVEMPIRSLFGALFTRMAAEEAATADISGVRIPAIITEQLNNAALDGAREAAQALKDAAQDASGVLIQLAAASAASDIAAVAARVTTLEGMPAVDLTTVNSRLDAAEAAIVGKADQTALDEGLLLKANQNEFTLVADRVTVVEANIAGNSGRLDAIESALPTKVAQADYDVYVASNDAAVALAQATATNAEGAAADASILAQAAEVKGLVSKLTVEDIITAGVNGAYWSETIGATIAAAADAGKLVNYVFDAPATVTLPDDVAGSPPANGSVRRIRNGHASDVLSIVLQSNTYEIVAGETMVWQFKGDSNAWRLI